MLASSWRELSWIRKGKRVWTVHLYHQDLTLDLSDLPDEIDAPAYYTQDHVRGVAPMEDHPALAGRITYRRSSRWWTLWGRAVIIYEPIARSGPDGPVV